MYDITLIGAGIMSTTLAKLLKELNPEFKILILESAEDIATESSGAWNNAGTGHAGYCELNYTPERKGVIDISKALEITESFEVSKQFWSFIVEKYGYDPSIFIHGVPHMSFVTGKDVPFLKKRWDIMSKHHFYNGMQYSEHAGVIKAWAPMSIEGRRDTHVAATHKEGGTDVDFGELTKILTHSLIENGVKIRVGCKVKDIKRDKSNHWEIYFDSTYETKRKFYSSKYVFIGSGGASLLLLEKTGIPQSRLYGGFPIRGEWLVCNDPYIKNQHGVKMYGKPDLGAPPMSVPHLDTRIINGKKELLFGPAAGFSTKFLKNGSYWDLFKSIKYYNIYSMLKAGYHNIPLTKYLINQLRQSFDDKIRELRKYYPNAIPSQWDVQIAGQRVQVIKKDKKYGGVLQFGTEIVVSDDGTAFCVLGASPGASKAVDIAIEITEKCFPEMKSEEWIKKMCIMVPSYKQSLVSDKDLYSEINKHTTKILKIDNRLIYG